MFSAVWISGHVGLLETSGRRCPLWASSCHAVAQLWGPTRPWRWWWLQPRGRWWWLQPRGGRRWLRPWMGRPVLQAPSKQWPQCREDSRGRGCWSSGRSHAGVCPQPSWVRGLWRIRRLWGLWRIWRWVWIPTVWRRLWPKTGLRAWGLWRLWLLLWSLQQRHLQQHHRCHRLSGVSAHGALDGSHVKVEREPHRRGRP